MRDCWFSISIISTAQYFFWVLKENLCYLDLFFKLLWKCSSFHKNSWHSLAVIGLLLSRIYFSFLGVCSLKTPKVTQRQLSKIFDSVQFCLILYFKEIFCSGFQHKQIFAHNMSQSPPKLNILTFFIISNSFFQI